MLTEVVGLGQGHANFEVYNFMCFLDCNVLTVSWFGLSGLCCLVPDHSPIFPKDDN